LFGGASAIQQGNRFTLYVDNSTTYMMYCDTAEATERWVAALHAVIDGTPELFMNNLKPDKTATPSHGGANSAVASPNSSTQALSAQASHAQVR
jgi:hypothetical protein